METIRDFLNAGSDRRKDGDSRSQSPASTNSSQAPHPIPAGSEGKVCPISGLFAESEVVQVDPASKDQLLLLQADPDIAEEIRALRVSPTLVQADKEAGKIQARKPVQFVIFNAYDGSHKSNASTRQLVQEVGHSALYRFTHSFYQKCFDDPHIDAFIADTHEPHPERFALWIQEKFGDGTPWTEERRTRPEKFMRFGHQVVEVSHDRSSAHFAAWHSPKRDPAQWGNHFKPEDARVWMRLHFWAARETGMFEHEAFMEYYTRFIGHFMSVYSSKAPPFTRESMRWSADPRNIQKYLDAGRVMTDVIGKDVHSELAKLPAEERIYTGSRARNAWPYEQRYDEVSH
jgi:truncated hemoglobin YjbI